jgi:hypothetical protein
LYKLLLLIATTTRPNAASLKRWQETSDLHLADAQSGSLLQPVISGSLGSGVNRFVKLIEPVLCVLAGKVNLSRSDGSFYRRVGARVAR